LQAAVEAYANLRGRVRGDYGVENRLQVTAVRDLAGARQLERELDSASPGPAATSVPEVEEEKIVDASPARVGDFWARAASGDRTLTQLMLDEDEDGRRGATEILVTEYRKACSGRSTFAERSSSVDHLRDLHDLLAEDDPRRPYLTDALKVLQPWSLFNPDPVTANTVTAHTVEGGPPPA
jgi:hypothetical protein